MVNDTSKTYVPPPSAGSSGMGSQPTTRRPSTGREYRGPTPEQIKAGTLAVGVPTTAHRKSARTAALTQSGMRAGQTPAQAAAESTKAVYGTQSTQAKQAQATLINEQKIAASRRSVIKDLRGGVIGGVKVIQTPHVKIPVDPRIHIRTEILAGKKVEDYPSVASQIKSMQESQRSAYRQLQSDASKLQKLQSQLHITEQRLDKAPIKDGVFVGTEAQYNKYLADYKAYTNKHKEVDTAINKYNSDIRKTEIEGYKLEKLETKTRRAQYGGLVGKYEDIELKVSKKIPTLYDISRKGAEFRKKHPEAANKLYTTFQKAHAKTEKVGTIEQRNALAGYTYGSYQSLQRQPVKTSAMFAAGLGSVKALSMVGKVGKAYGAGKWSARVAKGVQYGVLAYYGKQSYNHIMSAPNSYEAGQRAAKIMYTEVLPMAAGIKAVEVAPKVVRVVIRKTGFISREFKAGTKRMLADDRAQAIAGKTQKQRLDELVRKEEARLKRPLFESEYKALEGLVGMKQPKAPRTVKTAKDLFKKIDAENKHKVDSGKYTEVKQKDGTVLLAKVVQKPLIKPVVKAEVKPLTKQSLKEVVKLKEQFELKIDPKQKIKLKQEAKQRALAKEKEVKLKAEQKFESVFKEEQRLATQAKQKLIAHEREMMALADAMPSFKRASKVKQIQKVKVVTKTEQRVIARLTQKQKQVMTTATRTKTAVKTATKTAQKVKTEVRTATKTKVKTKTQQKTKLAVLIALRHATQTDVQLLTKALEQLKAATKEVQEIKPAVAMVTATTTKTRTLTDLDTLKRIVRESIAEQKAAAKELIRAIRAIETLKLKIPPPPIPIKKIPTKKKPTKKRREAMVLKQKNLNAVATFRDLLGGL